MGYNETPTTNGTTMKIALMSIDRLKKLEDVPGGMLISNGGTELYISHPSGIIMFTGPHFGFMSDVELKNYVKDQMNE